MGSVSTPTGAEDRARIAARYPSRRPIDVLVFAVAAVALLGAVAVVVIAGVQRANPPVAAMVRQFEVTSPQEVAVTLVIQRTDPGDAVTCSLFAQAVSFEYVGERDVTIPPGTETLTRFDTTINTLKEATSVSVESCVVTR